MKELHTTNSVQSNAEMFGEAETLNSLRHPCIIAFYGVVVNQVCITPASMRSVVLLSVRYAQLPFVLAFGGVNLCVHLRASVFL